MFTIVYFDVESLKSFILYAESIKTMDDVWCCVISHAFKMPVTIETLDRVRDGYDLLDLYVVAVFEGKLENLQLSLPQK